MNNCTNNGVPRIMDTYVLAIHVSGFILEIRASAVNTAITRPIEKEIRVKGTE
ncbi:hypothetical protein GCM10008967_39550 [Bacillus carboniphilus]|uniref:Uncharacterized protein n=1 Tax=Bacillus carboniphilus TaxID=86663 RepID=A0ABN0WRV0_9BACI